MAAPAQSAMTRQLLLLLIAFAVATAASFDNGDNPTKLSAASKRSIAADAFSAVAPTLPRAAEQPSYRRQLSQAAAKPKPKLRKTIKYSYTSKGDFFQLSADQSDANGFAYFYVWGSNNVYSSSDPSGSQTAVPTQSIYLSFSSCKTSTVNPSGDIVWSDCIDVWGSSDSALKLSVDKAYSGSVSASFAGSKAVPYSDPLPVTISLALTLPCNKANITKFDSTCKSSSKASGSSPMSRYRSEYKSGTTNCAIERGSVSGSIRVDVPGSSSIDILAFFKTAVTDSASATTGTTKDSSISISKGFMF